MTDDADADVDPPYENFDYESFARLRRGIAHGMFRVSETQSATPSAPRAKAGDNALLKSDHCPDSVESYVDPDEFSFSLSSFSFSLSSFFVSLL